MDSKKENISQQIEQDSNFFDPSVYNVLTFHEGLQTSVDEDGGNFIPLTSVVSKSTNDALLFAIGLIPPASVITDKLLDRTAFVNALTPDYKATLELHPGAGSSSYGNLPGQTGDGSTSYAAAAVDPGSNTLLDDQGFWIDYVKMCNRLGCDPKALADVLQSESSFLSGNVSTTKDGRPIAKGLFQLTKATANSIDMPADVYASFEFLPPNQQLFWMEKFYSGRVKGKSNVEIKTITFGSYGNPDGSVYSLQAEQNGFRNPKSQVRNYLANKDLDQDHKGYISKEDLARTLIKNSAPNWVVARIDDAKEKLGQQVDAPAAPEESDIQASDNWEKGGADNAYDASRAISLQDKRALDRTKLGDRFLEAQKGMIRELQSRLEVIANTPPLRMLVNPTSLRRSFEKIQTDGGFGRNGPVPELWGDNMIRVEGSGKVSAFFSMLASNANGPGLSRTARQFSKSYQNFLSLFLLYKNNGGVWIKDPISNDATAQNLALVGSVYLYYDSILYIGSFESLSITETEDAPFSLEYSFTFHARYMYRLDHLDNNQYTYGQPKPSNQT